MAAVNNAGGVFSGLAAGNYNVSTTVSGCTSTATSLIINPIPNAPIIAASSVTIVNTNVGSSNGSISLIGALTGGSGTFSYQWYTGTGITAPIVGAVNATITNLAAGTYTVVATDQINGCATAPQTFDIYEDAQGVELIINSFITPNSGDKQNNVLYVKNIELFPENTVKLLDRWGILIKSWTNFSNYGSSNAEQADFDFSTLTIGNYICIIEYKNSTNGDKKNHTQMISVLK